MATSTLKGIRDNLTKIVECGICHDCCIDPRNLPCQHSFCLPCIQNLIDKSAHTSRFNCPYCRDEVQVPREGPEALPKAYIFTMLKDTLDQYQTLDPSKCTACLQDGKHIDAKKFCTDCKKGLCSTCLASHNRFMNTHRLLDCDNVHDISEFLKNSSEKCKKHGRDIELYCQDCEDFICITCFAVDHGSHQKHEIETVAKEHRADLEAMHGRMSTRSDQYDECLQQVYEELQNRQTQKQTKLETLDRHEEQLIQMVKEVMNELRHKITAKADQSPELTSLKQTLSDEKKCLFDCKERIEALLEHGKNTAIIEMNIKERKGFESLLQKSKADHQLPKLRLDLQLTEVCQLIKPGLAGIVHSLIEDEPLKLHAKRETASDVPTPGPVDYHKTEMLYEKSAITNLQLEDSVETREPRVVGKDDALKTPTVKEESWHDPAYALSITECAADGSYITLHNTNKNIFARNIGGWRVVRSVDGVEIVNVKLPQFRMKYNEECKLFARGLKAAAIGRGSNGGIECDVRTWRTGNNVVTTLYDMYKNKRATHAYD